MIPDPALVAQALEAFDNGSLVALNKPNRFFYDPVHYPLQSITPAVFAAARWFVSVFTTDKTKVLCFKCHQPKDHYSHGDPENYNIHDAHWFEPAVLVATQEDTDVV